MNITLNIQAESPAELQEAITGLAGIVGGTVTTKPAITPEESEKPKRTRSKPEKQQDPEPVNEPGAEDAGSPNSEASDPENIPTVVDLRAKAQEKGKTPEGKKAIKALLEEFGSKSISDLPEEKRAAFLARLEEL